MAAPYQTLDVSQRLADEQGRSTPYLENFLYLREILMGSGSPEGVVSATPTTLYMDTAGLSGSILYIKQSGTGNTGWILV